MAFNDCRNKCRICLNNFPQNSQLKTINTKTNDDICYEDLIAILSGDEVQKISESARYPKHICLICEKGMLFAYKFKNKLIRANSKLKCFLCAKKNSKITNSASIVSLYNNKCYRRSNASYLKTSNESFYTAKTDNIGTSRNSLLFPEITISSLPQHDCYTENLTSNLHIESNYFDEIITEHEEHFNKVMQSCSTQVTEELQNNLPVRPRPYKCNICNRTFALKSNLSYHIHSHGNRQKSIKCNHCGKEFEHWIQRRNHIYSEHSGDPSYTSTISEKNINNSTSVKNIQFPSHPYKCEICQKRFKNSASLKYHAASHIKPKSNSSVCTANHFSKQSVLRKHIKTNCDGKNFIQNRIIKSHILKNKFSDELTPPAKLLSQIIISTNH